MKHYLKEIISRDVFVAGAKLKFEDFGDGNGGVVTANPIIIAELDRLVAAGKGGLVRVSAEEYDEAKKKASPWVRPATTNVASPWRTSAAAQPPSHAPAAAATVASDSPGLTVPTTRIPKAVRRADMAVAVR